MANKKGKLSTLMDAAFNVCIDVGAMAIVERKNEDPFDYAINVGFVAGVFACVVAILLATICGALLGLGLGWLL